MPTGAITGYIDVAQVVLYVFWVFFAGLIWYLHRENKREGYPLVAEDRRTESRVQVQGFPAVPPAKTFLLRDGKRYLAPPGNIDDRAINAVPVANFPGAPLQPLGNPMVDGIGTASYALREDMPDLTAEDQPRIVPIRVDPHHSVSPEDPNPVGMPVVAADNRVAGVVVDLWVDRSEPRITYLEVEIEVSGGYERVLLPFTMAKVDRRRGQVRTGTVLAAQFVDAPRLKNPDVVTKLEEDRICGYFAGGYLYATPDRKEPLL